MTSYRNVYQVVITVDSNNLGKLLDSLPPKLKPSINRLLDRDELRLRRANGREAGVGTGNANKTEDGLRPTGVPALMMTLFREHGKLTRIEARKLLVAKGHEERAVSSAFAALVRRKLIRGKRGQPFEVVTK